MNSFPRHLRGPSTTEPTLIAAALSGGAFVMSLLPLGVQVASVAAVVGGGFLAYEVRSELRIRRRLRAMDTPMPAAAAPSEPKHGEACTVAGVSR